MEKNVYTVQIDPELLASSTGSKTKSVLPKIQAEEEDFFDFSKLRHRGGQTAERGFTKQVTGEHKNIKKKLAKIDDYSEFDFNFGFKSQGKGGAKESAETLSAAQGNTTSKAGGLNRRVAAQAERARQVIEPIERVSVLSGGGVGKVDKNSLRRKFVAKLSKSGLPTKKISITKIIEVNSITPNLKRIRFLPAESVKVSQGGMSSEVAKQFKERLLSLKKLKNEVLDSSNLECREPEPAPDSEVERVLMIARLGSLFDCDAGAIL